MQAGCGLKVRRIRSRWYVYGWHYDGGSRKVEVYAGRAGRARTNERAIRFLLEQDVRARAALDRRIERYRAALARFEP
jgi:hypothetical protein